MTSTRNTKKCHIVIIVILAFVTATYFIITYGVSYHYQKAFERIYHNEFFPNNKPVGYHNVVQRIQGGSYLGRQNLKAIRNLTDNRYQDRWANYPILHKIIEYHTRFPDDMPSLVSLIGDTTLPERTRLKATGQFAKIISDKAEGELRYPLGNPIRISQQYANILLEIARSKDYDLLEVRCCAMRALGATGIENAIPILLENTGSSPKRLRFAAYQGLINISRIDGFGSHPEVRGKLLSLLTKGEHQPRIQLLDSLPELSHKSGMTVSTDDIMALLNDSDNDVVYRALHIMQARDEIRAIDKTLALVESPSPDVRRFCRSFLERTERLSPEQLWPLAKHDSMEVRVLALAVAFRQNAYGTKSEQFRDILLAMENDPNQEIALVASMYLERSVGKSRQKEYHRASAVKENLFKAVFDPPKSPSPTRTAPAPTPEEINAKQQEWLAERKAIINQAGKYFSQAAEPGIHTDIYQLLISKFANKDCPLIIRVPKLADTGGLYAQNESQIILSQEQARTLREDYNYTGPGLYLSEIFINSDKSEAWIEVTTYQAFLSAQGRGIILRKHSGKWNIVSQKLIWIS